MKKILFVVMLFMCFNNAFAEDCEVWLGHWQVVYQDGTRAHWAVDWATNEPLSSGSRCQAKGTATIPGRPEVKFQIRWFVYVNAYIYIEHQGDMQGSDNVTEMILADDAFTVQASDHGITSGERITCTDADRDGYYTEGGTCGPADCDDADAALNPGAAETCGDTKDNNCNGGIDETCNTLCVNDKDGDGYYTEGGACGLSDCDDTDKTIHPNTQEICGDSRDNNCDNQTDEDCSLGCVDTDGDGYGVNCEQGADCDDSDPHVHPGQEELCGDKRDNDCDGVVDNGCGPQFCPASALLGENDPRVETLRKFRDQVMAHSWIGKKLIRFYYHNSDAFDETLKNNPAFRRITVKLLEASVMVIEKIIK